MDYEKLLNEWGEKVNDSIKRGGLTEKYIYGKDIEIL